MKDQQLQLLLKARQSLMAATILLNNNFFDYAASRAYYTMFYIAEAFLAGEGMSFYTHPEVISAFGREFTETGRVPAEFHRYFIDAQEIRIMADYRGLNTVTMEQAIEVVTKAEDFLKVSENLIGILPPP